jgi:hypothetical protein
MLKPSALRFLLLIGLIIFGVPGVYPEAVPDVPKLQAAPIPDNRVVVYQFHRRFRCEACHTLEATIRETFNTHFPEEIEAGRLVFEVVDLDADGNGHYAEDFDFFYNTVIVVDVEQGQETRFKNLEEVWSLVDNKQKAMEFIRSHVAEYL